MIILGPKILREIASIIKTNMSRVPRKTGEKEKGGEFIVYLSEDQEVLAPWISA